ncbi:MAG TPA: superoxide dismutase [Pirellulaceae bacterium]|nr:superoxide dismutase [Pirellulaceae bacterium]
MERRHFLQATSSAVAVAALSGSVLSAAEEGAKKAADPLALPPLPYAYDALEPYIDAETMKIHHDKHHQAYINNLIAAIKDHPSLQGRSSVSILSALDKVPEEIRVAVRNNAGGDANHRLFWEIMGTSKKDSEPTGKLAEAIKSEFGSLASFKEKFSTAGIKRFGSGWAWLSVGKGGKLTLESLPNQDSPILEGRTPILGLDVWEHAYYLKYKNLRPDYVAAWWNVVNWDVVASKYAEALKNA